MHYLSKEKRCRFFDYYSLSCLVILGDLVYWVDYIIGHVVSMGRLDQDRATDYVLDVLDLCGLASTRSSPQEEVTTIHFRYCTTSKEEV